MATKMSAAAPAWREEWNKVKYVYDESNDEMEGEVASSFKQCPLKPGWAVTIHKAQG